MPELMTEQQLEKVLWEAVRRLANEESDSAPFDIGKYSVRLMITAEIDGQTIHKSASGTLATRSDFKYSLTTKPLRHT